MRAPVCVCMLWCVCAPVCVCVYALVCVCSGVCVFQCVYARLYTGHILDHEAEYAQLQPVPYGFFTPLGENCTNLFTEL